jgi:hypothetical protein
VDRYLQYWHRSRENRFSGLGSFHFDGSAFQLPSPLRRVSSVRRHRSFLCRACAARFLRPSANFGHGCPRDASHALKLAACPSAVCEPAGLSPLLTPSPGRAVRLARPAHLHLPGAFIFGYTGLNCLQPTIQTGIASTCSPSICSGFQAKAAQPTLPARHRLTRGSTRTPTLAIASRF